MSKFSPQAILEDLDESIFRSSATFFPAMHEPDCPLIGAKIRLFADKNRWAIVFERFGYQLRQRNYLGQLTFFGNCLKGLYLHNGEASNQSYFFPVDLAEIQSLEKEGELDPEARIMKVRDQKVPVTTDPVVYRRYEIPEDNRGGGASFLRQGRLWFAQGFGPVFCASENEIRAHLPVDLPELTTISSFHFQPYYRLQRRSITTKDMDENWAKFMGNSLSDEGSTAQKESEAFAGTRPSSTELWFLVAEILAYRQPERYRPVMEPNQHWKNWDDPSH